MGWLQIAMTTPLALLVYLLITDFVDLFPFNDISKKIKERRGLEVLFNYLPLVLASLCAWLQMTGTIAFAILISVTYLIGHILAWWKPYFFGCSDEWQKKYEWNFSRTVKILPPIKNHPIPDAEHLPVGILSVLMLVSTVVTFVHHLLVLTSIHSFIHLGGKK